MPVSEYPDTAWVGLPAAWGSGRDGKAVRLSVIHYTAGRAGPGAALAGARYDKERKDGTSTHCFHDSQQSVQEVWTRDRANAAFGKGNRLGIQHELCASAMSREWWLHDEVGFATLRRAARASAWDCVTYSLQPRRLSVEEVRATWYNFPKAPGGICGHVDITNAFEGDHTDPGPGFPWVEFESMVQGFVRPTSVIGRGKVLFSCSFKEDPKKAIYISDGFQYRHLKTWPGFQKLVGLGVVSNMDPWVFNSVEEMEVVAGDFVE